MEMAVLVIEIVLVTVLVSAICFLAWLFIRRRWLSSRGGVFDCALKRGDQQRWSLGMARYEGDELCWYQVFSLNLVPNLTIHRRRATWGGRREPDSAESMVLFTDHQVVSLHTVDRKGRQVRYELAMTPASSTGLMSWLEASAPGAGLGYLDEN